MTTTDWWVEGSYFEACDCEAVCPCRRQGGRPGGRSTYGTCDFALSWWIDRGRAAAVTLWEVNGRCGFATDFAYRSDPEER